MNVLVIPSWYPSQKAPLVGTFCQEQAEALAACTDCNIIVCDWGQGDGAMPFWHPLDSLRALRWRIFSRSEVRNRHERFYEYFEPALIWSPRLPGGGDRRILAAMRRVYQAALRQFGKIDLLHAHVSYPGGYLVSRLTAATGVPYVLTEHMSTFPFPHYMVNGRPIQEIDLAMKGARAVVAVSRGAAEKIQSFGYQRVRVIPNLVDESRFVSRPKPDGVFRFFSMGGLTRQKGFDILLRAIAQWSPRAGEVEFVIAGQGAMKEELQSLAKQLGISRLVRWVGAISRNEAPAYYQDCHAFVLASRKESFGVVFAEAIASGRPIIATTSGGPEDIVNDANGVLVPVEDVPALAAALANMKEQHQRFNAVTIREDFMRRFSRPAVTRQIRQMYDEVLSRN